MIGDLVDAINRHIDVVSSKHRLRYAEIHEGDDYFVCICGDERFDRRNWNAHICEVYKLAALDERHAPTTR